jgi:hypothetical protein
MMRSICPLCGYAGPERDREGRCLEAGGCMHRRALERQGRPRESGCNCAAWPCPCRCHGDVHQVMPAN